MFALHRDIKIIAGLDRLPAAVNISLAMPLDHKEGVCLFFVLMDGGFRTGSYLNQADTGHIGLLACDKHRGLDIVEYRVLGENHFPLRIKFCLHGSLLTLKFCRRQSPE